MPDQRIDFYLKNLGLETDVRAQRLAIITSSTLDGWSWLPTRMRTRSPCRQPPRKKAAVRHEAASGFAGITEQLDAVDGKHPPADQALPITNENNPREDGGNVIFEVADERCDGSVGDWGIARECHEQYVLLVDAFDSTAADKAPWYASSTILSSTAGS